MDKISDYPVFWKGEIYLATTHPEKEDYVVVQDFWGNFLDVPASEVILYAPGVDKTLDAELAADAKFWAEYDAVEEKLESGS